MWVGCSRFIKEEMIMGRIGIPEVILIVLAIIILFGAKKLPEIGSALGKAIREFRKAGKDIQDDIKDVVEDKSDEQKP
jgi:sec-independent protein translocase protein TatA